MLLQLFTMIFLLVGLSSADTENNVTQCVRKVVQLTAEFHAIKTEMESKLDNIANMQKRIMLMIEHKLQHDVKIPARNRRSAEETDRKPLPRDCSDLLIRLDAKQSGVYTVYVGRRRRPVQVYCDMSTDSGGWTVFQRRKDGSENFYRSWSDYKNGFGNVTREFWLGNEVLHIMTSSRNYHLRVDLGDWYGNFRYAEYSNFQVSSECEKYKLLSIGTYCGNAGDSLLRHAGQRFSTFDRDNDPYSKSCAVLRRGAWWYKDCHDSNLNGKYLRGPTTPGGPYGVGWNHWKGPDYSLEFTEMKIRPSDI